MISSQFSPYQFATEYFPQKIRRNDESVFRKPVAYLDFGPGTWENRKELTPLAHKLLGKRREITVLIPVTLVSNDYGMISVPHIDPADLQKLIKEQVTTE